MHNYVTYSTLQMNSKESRKKAYTRLDVNRAFEMIRGGVSIYKAAKLTGVPEQTLRDHVKGKVSNLPQGRPKVLTSQEEKIIATWVLEIAERGIPVTLKMIGEEVGHVMSQDVRATEFKEGAPGKRWLQMFMMRNPELTQRRAQLASAARLGVTEANLRQWHESAYAFFSKKPELLEALNDPRRVFNMDESGFAYEAQHHRMAKVVVASDSRQTYKMATGSRAQVTIAACFNANGDWMYPFAIFPGKNLSGVNPVQHREQVFFWAQSSGWMDQDGFTQWIAAFDRWLSTAQPGIPRPVIVFMDNNVSHVSHAAIVMAREKKIELYTLFPNSTHIMQPADLGFFGPLKAAYSIEAEEWLRNHYGEAIKKANFLDILIPAWKKATKKSTAENAFRRCGLFPFVFDAIDRERLKNLANFGIEQTSQTMQAQATTATTTQEVEEGGVNEADLERSEVSTTFATNEPASASTSARYIGVMPRGTPSDLYVSPVFKEMRVPATEPPKRKINFKLNSALTSDEVCREAEMRESKKVEAEAARKKRKEERELKKEKKKMEAGPTRK